MQQAAEHLLSHVGLHLPPQLTLNHSVEQLEVVLLQCLAGLVQHQQLLALFVEGCTAAVIHQKVGSIAHLQLGSLQAASAHAHDAVCMRQLSVSNVPWQSHAALHKKGTGDQCRLLAEHLLFAGHLFLRH